LFIGNLAGNRFELVIKNAADYTVNQLTSFVNYFGEQRFSRANALVGKLLLQKKYDVALKTILEHTHERQTVKKLQAHLALKPNDAIGGLRLIPDNILSLYLHAYQSYLWNKAASLLCGDGVVDGELAVVIPRQIPTTTKIPLVGFEYESSKYDAIIADTLNNVLLEDGLTNRDFIIRAIPTITQMGGTRDLVAPIHDLVFSDEESVKKISFSLDSGCYATVALRHLLVVK
jgi:tRNA pseudouridine13 synthase